MHNIKTVDTQISDRQLFNKFMSATSDLYPTYVMLQRSHLHHTGMVSEAFAAAKAELYQVVGDALSKKGSHSPTLPKDKPRDNNNTPSSSGGTSTQGSKSSSGPKSKQKSRKSTIECYYCKKKGYKSPDCRTKKKDEQEEGAKSVVEVANHGPADLCILG